MIGDSKLPRAIRPVYRMRSANRPVTLYKGQLEIRALGDVHGGQGQCRLSWLPTPRIHYDLKDQTFSPLKLTLTQMSDPDEIVLTIPSRGLSVTTTSLAPANGTLPSQGCIVGQQLPVERILLHLPNFHWCRAKRVKIGRSVCLGRLTLMDDIWTVTVDEVPNALRLVQELDDTGGFAFTHVAEVRKKDKTRISYLEADDIMDALSHFLSFCRGFWCCPQLPVGIAQETHVWERWEVRHLSPWQVAFSWFPAGDSARVAHAFNGFMQKWRDHCWCEALRLAIKWYVEANQQLSMEAQLVLSLTALEMLAWALLVEHPPACDECGFDRLPAADKLRLILHLGNVPADIPSQSHEVLSYNKGQTPNKRWTDGPHAATDLRNAVVHGRAAKRQKLLALRPELVHEVSNLALWYLEMMLLWLMDFKGPYANRLERSKQCAVPWGPGQN